RRQAGWPGPRLGAGEPIRQEPARRGAGRRCGRCAGADGRCGAGADRAEHAEGVSAPMLNAEELERCAIDVMRTSGIPGLATAIAGGNGVINARGVGLTSVGEGGLPVTPQTLFRIGSTTKPLTGTAAMRLVEQGRLELDTPIKRYIDWFAMRDPGAAERVTLRMLLSHTSGLPTDWEFSGQRDVS